MEESGFDRDKIPREPEDDLDLRLGVVEGQEGAEGALGVGPAAGAARRVARDLPQRGRALYTPTTRSTWGGVKALFRE